MRPPRTASLALVLSVFWLFAAADPAQNEQQRHPDSSVKDELKRHQGTWNVISSTYDGQQAAPEVVRSIRRIVSDDRVVWERNGERFAGSKIELDSTREPKTIDVIPDGGPNRGEHVLGIYRLEDDTLTICMAAPGKPRPSKFEAEKGSECTLRKYHRAPPSAR